MKQLPAGSPLSRFISIISEKPSTEKRNKKKKVYIFS
jgi:hypothetical protein